MTAIGVTGKPFVFAAGADIKGMALISEREQAMQMAQLGHQVFRRLLDSPVPTFAFLNGATLGGGLELALHCHYRTLAASVTAIAFPEVFLGILPGWGGTQLLPRLIGPSAAVKVIIDNPLNQNRMLRADQAAQLGLVDVLLSDADFLAESLRWAARVVTGEVTVTRDSHATDDWNQVVETSRAGLELRLHGGAPAPYKALELIARARTADLDTGSASETDAVVDLVMSDQLRAGTVRVRPRPETGPTSGRRARHRHSPGP